MKLLVSVINLTEAIECIKGGADIIDVKNPKEGSLGANFPHVIKAVREVMPKSLELSATIGDLPSLPGTASLAALGAAVSGADYVKVGLFGPKNVDEATAVMNEVVKAVKDYDPSLKTIASGYADYKSVGCVSPLLLPEVANKTGADGVLVDVKVKDGKSNLFTYLSDTQLKEFIEKAHKYDLLAALAGSLGPQNVSRVRNLGADIIGVRGAICEKNDRVNGKLERKKVADFVNEISKL